MKAYNICDETVNVKHYLWVIKQYRQIITAVTDVEKYIYNIYIQINIYYTLYRFVTKNVIYK